MDVVVYEKPLHQQILNLAESNKPSTASSKPPNMASSTDALQKRLGELGRCIHDVPKDGHCIPNAIANFLRIERKEEYTATGILDRLRGIFEDHSEYFGDFGLQGEDLDNQLDAYIDHKRFDSDIVDYVITAFATMLAIKVVVITETMGGAVSEEPMPPIYGTDSTRTVYLLRRGSDTRHYDALIQVNKLLQYYQEQIRRKEQQNNRASTAKSRQDLQDLKDAQAKLKDAQSNVDAERREKEKLAEEKRKLKEEIERLNGDINSNKNKMGNLEEKCGNMQGDRDQLRIDKDKLAKENEALKRKLQEAMDKEKGNAVPKQEPKPEMGSDNIYNQPPVDPQDSSEDDDNLEEDNVEEDDADWGTLTLTSSPEGLVVGEGGIPGTDLNVDDVITAIGSMNLASKSSQEVWELLQDALIHGDIELAVTRN